MFETLLRPGDTEERCGLILENGEAVELTNISGAPAQSFEIDPDEMFRYVNAGQVVGTWHTHPNSDPNLSGDDHSAFRAWPDLFHVIIGMRDGKVTVAKFTLEDGVILRCD